MRTDEKDYLIPVTLLHPGIFTGIGFFAGISIWITDAFIDAFLINHDESFLESLIHIEGSELWMRLLIVLVLTTVGFFASQAVRKSHELNKLLLKYQNELEGLVEQRTIDLQKKTNELERLAGTDPLTEIYNRRKFLEVCETEFQRYKRHHHKFSVLMLDIDNFKNINDQYGHDIGDAVIVSLAKILINHTRSTDYFARWGGEEFIILSPMTEEDGRCMLADKLVKIIDQHVFDTVGHVTASIGVTTSQEYDEELNSIIKRADDALYHAKAEGKNQYQFID